MTGTTDFVLKVYDNGDHTGLVWLPPEAKPVPGCRGFTVRRTKNGAIDYLHGFVGFSDDQKLDPQLPWKFPLQRFMWWDYSVRIGDAVQYSVVPVVGADKDHLALAPELASPPSPTLAITGQRSPHVSAYFNKGIVAAQWVSRALDAAPAGSSLKTLAATPGDPLRNGLSGALRPQILSLLSDAQRRGEKIFAALYELNDPELIPALTAFGPNCSLILGNGSFSTAHPDENADVRQQLRDNSQIALFDRIVATGHFAHDKFVVFCDPSDNPLRVLTGSTNWTSSGLCTQANNAIVIDDPSVAGDYLSAWHRMKDAGNAYPAELISGNSTTTTVPIDDGTATPWFAPTSGAQDLDYARRLINAATEGILFLFFNPGVYESDPAKWTLLQSILARQDDTDGNANFDASLYVRGVVNQAIAGLTEPLDHASPGAVSPAATDSPGGALSPGLPSPVTLFRGSDQAPLPKEVLVPHNVKSQFHDWERELLGAGLVNVHSKVIVLDPFGETPVVMTGSHNLGLKASSKNDDKLIIVEGNGPLAVAYAINIIAIYDSYRWNSYVEQHRADPTVWHGLVDNDAWQSGYLTGDHLAEIEFWLGGRAAA
jgi:phosphatidylserine/phosphatidylglycerophosphate/cardiolipin synthase-like enzyme